VLKTLRVNSTAFIFGLILAEFVIFAATFYGGLVLSWVDFSLNAAEVKAYLPRSVTYAGGLTVCLFVLGLYRRECLFRGSVMLPRMILAFLLAVVLFALIVFALKIGIWRAVLVGAMPLSFASVILLRVSARRCLDPDSFKRIVAVIGSGRQAARIAALEDAPDSTFKIDGFLADEGGSPLSVEAGRIIQPGNSIRDALRARRIEQLVIATERSSGLPDRELIECRLSGMGIVDYQTFHALETGRVDLDYLEPNWFLVDQGFHGALSYRWFKRMVDLVFGGFLFLVTLPLMLLLVVAIWLEDRGSVLYRQRRVGLHGKVFWLLKLRSMRLGAEADGVPRWSDKSDARVTAVGQVIRRLRLDELPQLLNIVKGEMSFVGPRPERPYFVERLAEENPFYLDRHSIKPGLTGWAQINFPYARSFSDARRKLEYDLFYIKYGDILLDIVIILQTVRVVISPNSSA